VKALFVICGLVIIGLSILAVGTLSEARTDVPVMYWTTDSNPARARQIATFEKWMKEHGYGEVVLKLDTNNQGVMKVIIQSASGVGSELIDLYGATQLRQCVAAGVLKDVTDQARQYGFDLSKTYPGSADELTVAGRQYAFPCNVTTEVVTINQAILDREPDLPRPKFDWTWDEFLTWCKAVRKVDSRGNVTRYAIWPNWGFTAREIWPTNGGSIFNETMTRCTLDSPAVLEATKFYYDLMFVHKVMPTPTDILAQSAQAGYGDVALHTLGNGLSVSVPIGRYGLIQLRKFKDFRPDVALLPYKVAPMQFIFARATGVNAGARDPNLAARFLQYLASEAYNRLIIDDGDALPPDPAMAYEPEFLRPSAYPGEHDTNAHAKYALAAKQYGVGRECSDFILPSVVNRIVEENLQGIANQVLSPEDGLRRMTDEINVEIQRAVERDPKLQPAYREACRLQEEIDRLKAAGKPVPPERIANPVLRRLRELGK
jgi:multiple sugar transport system substrate-binding protein